MAEPLGNAGLRIPESLRRQTQEIFELIDPFCAEHLDAEYAELCRRLVARLLANKARLIRDLLRIGLSELELCRREVLESHPMAWMISVNGLIVDARTMPPEIQAKARRRGLIPET